MTAEAVFVGRGQELDELIQAWNDRKQIFGIFGLQRIGKSSLVEELFRRLQVPGESVYRLDYANITSLEEMIRETKCGLNIDRELTERNWIRYIVTELKNRVNQTPGGGVVVFVRHYGDVDEVTKLKNEFIKLSEELAKASERIRVIITSRYKIRYASMQMKFKSLHLHRKLTNEESMALLMNLLENQVHLGKYGEMIVERCDGLPFPLMIVANELKEDEKALKPEDMVLLLEVSRLDPLSREGFYAEHERMRHLIGDPILKLTEAFKQPLAMLNHIQGPFDKRTGAAVVDAPNNAVFMDKYMIEFSRWCLYSYDGRTGCFSSNNLQSEFVGKEVKIGQEEITIKRRFAQIYQERLEAIGNSEGQDVFLRNLSKQVSQFGGASVFPDFVQMAADANFFNQQHLGNNPIDVSEVMLSQCVKPECALQEGIPLSLLAKLVIEQAGSGIRSLRSYVEEVRSLNTESQKLAELYQAIGCLYLIGGDAAKALQYHMNCHNILVRLGYTEVLTFAKCLNYCGYSFVLSGNWAEALNYLLQSLQLRVKILSKDHVAIAIHCHNIRLLCCQVSTMEKTYIPLQLKKEFIPTNFTFVHCLHDISKQFLMMRLPEKALETAKEGIRILNTMNSVDENVTGPFYTVVTKAFVDLNQFKEAESYLKGILFRLPGQKPSPLVLSALNQLGFVYQRLGKIAEAEQIFLKAYRYRKVVAGQTSELHLETCRGLSQVYGHENKDIALLYDRFALDELHRLGDHYFRSDNRKQLGHIIDQIRYIVVQKGVPLPQCCADAPTCFLRHHSQFENMIYVDRDADDKEKDALRAMVHEVNAPAECLGPLSNRSAVISQSTGNAYPDMGQRISDEYSQRDSVPVMVHGQQYLNQASPSERISRRHAQDRHSRSESDYSPTGSGSRSNHRSTVNPIHSAPYGGECYSGEYKSFQSSPHSAVKQSNSTPNGLRDRELPSRPCVRGNVHLGNHNHSPHSQRVMTRQDLDERRLWSSWSSEGWRGHTGDQNDWLHRSCNGVGSDPSSSQDIWSNQRFRPESRMKCPESQSQTPTTPVESSWPSNFSNYSSSLQSLVGCDQVWTPSGVVAEHCHLEADGSPSLAPCISSLESLHLAEGLEAGFEHPGLPVSSCQNVQNPGTVGSLGVRADQKAGENDLLVHDHFRLNSQGQLEPQLSLLGSHHTAQSFENPNNTRVPDSLQHASYNHGLQTIPKEALSSPIVPPCGNSHQPLLNGSRAVTDIAPQSQTGLCRRVSPSHEVRGREFEGHRVGPIAQLSDRQIHQPSENASGQTIDRGILGQFGGQPEYATVSANYCGQASDNYLQHFGSSQNPNILSSRGSTNTFSPQPENPHHQSTQSVHNPGHLNAQRLDPSQQLQCNQATQLPGYGAPIRHPNPYPNGRQDLHIQMEGTGPDSCQSPISVSQSYKHYINLPSTQSMQQYQQLQPQCGASQVQHCTGFNQNTLCRPMQQPQSDSAFSHPRLFYPPNTWEAPASGHSLETNQNNNFVGSWGDYSQHASNRLSQSAPAPLLSHTMSSYGPPEMNLGAESAASSTPLPSSAPRTRSWSVSGFLEGIGLLSSSEPSKVHHL